MDNFDNEVFEFGTNPNEETSNFNYEEINYFYGCYVHGIWNGNRTNNPK